MPIQINSPSWKIRRQPTSRGGSRGVSGTPELPGLRPEFLTDSSHVAEEVVLEPAASGSTRGAATADQSLDLSYDLGPGETAVLALRHESGALSFHPPIHTKTRGTRGPSQVRFQVARVRPATRGVGGELLKAIIIKVAQAAADKAVSLGLEKASALVESAIWKQQELQQGWMKVSAEGLAGKVVEPGKPVSPERSLLLLHGTFSNAAAAYCDLAKTGFFDRIKEAYGDRVFAFNHFTVSQTPEDNARLLLQGLPEQSTTFDVVTHSRGGLVLRNLVERPSVFGNLSKRFKLGRAVLVASPNEGTPLATPRRWEETIGWIANLLDMFPIDNPFTTGAAFVGNGLVWLAGHAAGDLPGLRAMDGDGTEIADLQRSPGPADDAYSALVSNYEPGAQLLQRVLDAGIDQFFATANDLVVPSEGGWRVDPSTKEFIPASRIGCFGPGGNLTADSVTHINFFSQTETTDFLVNGLLGRAQRLKGLDPNRSLPSRRVARGAPRRTARGFLEEDAVVAASRSTEPLPPPLKISVVNGDLTFEDEALLLGHYRSTILTGTEDVMDRLIGGEMSSSLRIGAYPIAPGTHKVFFNRRPNLERGSFLPRPKAVIIVGLGEEGKLQAADLVQTVRQGVIAWSQMLADGKKHIKQFNLACTLIGSGGTGVRAGESARLIAQGVWEANALLQTVPERDRWPRVDQLRFIELYLDRATEAWQALRMETGSFVEADKKTFSRYIVDDAVSKGTGPLMRPVDFGYRGASFDFVTVESGADKDGTARISYTLDTKRARSEVRGQRAQSSLVKDLVNIASTDANNDRQIGRTLFNLLIPLELEGFLSGTGEVQLALDPQTAGIPWELLDSNPTDGDTRLAAVGERDPWAIRVKLLRKLRIGQFREHVADAGSDASVLVIGEPEAPKEYPRLTGARREAETVYSRLAATLSASSVSKLYSDDPSKVGPSAQDVIGKVFEKPWRIVHVAGHGRPFKAGETGNPDVPAGVVLSTGSVLGADEIGNMRTVPELVFINCCYLADGDQRQTLELYNRADFASGVAGALISIGVRCVVAAGWAVNDSVAETFADTFYSSLLQHNRFIDAVAEARVAAYRLDPNVNTWAAYQCYGDPDWVFRQTATDANRTWSQVADDFSGVASPSSLMLELQRSIVQTKYQGADPVEQLRKLLRLDAQFGEKWGQRGQVAELFGEAFSEAGNLEKSEHWYTIAVKAPDGTASMRAAEQLANVQARIAWEIVDQATLQLEAATNQMNAKGLAASARDASKRAHVAAEQTRDKALRRARRLTASSLALLEKLMAVEKTMERASLLGSARKRQALVNAAAGRGAQVQRDLVAMENAYRLAQEIGEKINDPDAFYPAANRLVAQVAMRAGTSRWNGLDRTLVSMVRDGLKAKSRSDPGFWSVVGENELDQLEALSRGRLSGSRTKLHAAYKDLYRRVKGRRFWGSVYDTACLVLPIYAERVRTTSEKTAARDLLNTLREYAHPTTASST